jgi:chromosome segregation ATPase
MDTKEMFSTILAEIREFRVETNKRLGNVEGKIDNLEGRMDNLESEVKATKQLVQNFKWDIDLLTDKQAKSEMAINRLEKRFES